MRNLLKLLGDLDVETLESRLNAGIERFKKTFGAYFTSFEDKEDHYAVPISDLLFHDE